MAQVLAPCWNQMHNHIFESSHFEGVYRGELLYLSLPLAQSTQPLPGDQHYFYNKTLTNHQGET